MVKELKRSLEAFVGLGQFERLAFAMKTWRASPQECLLAECRVRNLITSFAAGYHEAMSDSLTLYFTYFPFQCRDDTISLRASRIHK